MLTIDAGDLSEALEDGQAMLSAHPDIPRHLRLGESPLFRPSDNTVHYIDVLAKSIHFLHLDNLSRRERIECPEFLSCINFASGGGYIACYFRGVAFVGEDGSWKSLLEVVDAERASRVRLNDGAVDARGRLWFAELDLSISGNAPEVPAGFQAAGRMYRYDPDGTLSVHENSGIICGNGIGWTQDNRTMLFADSHKQIIWAYEFEIDTGTISNKRPFIDIRNKQGEPDGILLDSRDNVYVFLWEGMGVLKFDCTGQLVRRWDLNAWRVTHGAFVGPDLDQLLVTTADTDDLTRPWPEEEGGALFWITDCGEQGKLKNEFPLATSSTL